jgi:hypothetical protein
MVTVGDQKALRGLRDAGWTTGANIRIQGFFLSNSTVAVTTVLFNTDGASSPFRASSQIRDASESPLVAMEANACCTGLRSR